MQTIAVIFVIILSSLYVLDRIFSLIKCFIKGEKFTQKKYERLLTFLSVAAIITYFII